jgi:hypothetical protein
VRDFIRELLDSAAQDVRASHSLYAERPARDRTSAVLKMEVAMELLRAYRLLKRTRVELRNSQAFIMPSFVVE